MRKIIASMAYIAWLAAGVALALGGPKLGFSAYAATCAGLSLTITGIATHLILLSSKRAATLTKLLDAQDAVLQQIVERLDRAEGRVDLADARLSSMGDVKGTLQDVAAMLAVRAASGRPHLRAVSN